MGIFLGVLGIFLVAAAALALAGMIAGEWGLVIGAALLAAALVCVVVSALLGVAATYLQKPIIDNIALAFKAGQPQLPSLLGSCLQLVGVYLLAAACAYIQSNLMAQLAQKGCNKLRSELFDKLQQLPLSFFDAHTHGELMSRFTNDADNVQMALEQSVIQLISSAVTFVGVVVMMVSLSPLLFLASLVMLGGVMAVFAVFGRRSRKYFARQQGALGAVNGNIQEMIEGMKVVKAFNHEEQAKARFQSLNEEYRAAASQAGFYSSAIMPIASNLTNIGYAVTAVLGGALAMGGGGAAGTLSSARESASTWCSWTRPTPPVCWRSCWSGSPRRDLTFSILMV